MSLYDQVYGQGRAARITELYSVVSQNVPADWKSRVEYRESWRDESVNEPYRVVLTSGEMEVYIDIEGDRGTLWACVSGSGPLRATERKHVTATSTFQDGKRKDTCVPSTMRCGFARIETALIPLVKRYIAAYVTVFPVLASARDAQDEYVYARERTCLALDQKWRRDEHGDKKLHQTHYVRGGINVRVDSANSVSFPHATFTLNQALKVLEILRAGKGESDNA